MPLKFVSFFQSTYIYDIAFAFYSKKCWDKDHLVILRSNDRRLYVVTMYITTAHEWYSRFFYYKYTSFVTHRACNEVLLSAHANLLGALSANLAHITSGVGSFLFKKGALNIAYLIFVYVVFGCQEASKGIKTGHSAITVSSEHTP